MGIAISSRVYNRIGGVGKVGGIVGKKRIIYASLFILIGFLKLPQETPFQARFCSSLVSRILLFCGGF